MRPAVDALILLVTANVAPWAAARLLRARWSAPLDFGRVLRDGERLLGSHKTWRGAAASVVACGAMAFALDLGALLGTAFGALSIAGDALSSFAKRRLRLAPGTERLGIDQLPEALLPLVVLAGPLDLDVIEVAGVAAVFLLLDVATTRFRH